MIVLLLRSLDCNKWTKFFPLQSAPPADQLLRILKHQQWDNEVEPFSLPPGLQLVLGDVYGGSNSPTMSSNVLKWQQEQKDGKISNVFICMVVVMLLL